MSEVNKITHDPKIVKTLESRGITALEQIAILSPESLGLPDAKARSIIESARRTLAEENTTNIATSPIEVSITLKYINRAIIESACSTLGANRENCNIKRYAQTVRIGMKGKKRRTFGEIVEKARELKNLIDLKQKQSMIDEGITLSPDEIIAFAKERKFEGFCEEFFSDITGNELMKSAITISLFSAFDEPVHVLVLGDPGSSKTLARDILIKNISGLNAIGANVTKAGLVCNLSTGDPGALAVSDRRVVLIDEFDKINKNDLEYCYELLSNGRCSVHSARVHKDIVSHFILIAFGNPKSEVFNKAMPLSDIGMEKTLMSRFSLIVKTDTLTRSQKESLFKDRFLGKSKLSENSQFFDQWVKYARTHTPCMIASPTKIDELVRKVVDIVETHATTQLRRDLRMGDYIRRLSMAFARVEFVDVSDEIVDKAYALLEKSVDTWHFKAGGLGFLFNGKDNS